MRTTVLLALIGIFFFFALRSQFAAMYTYWWFAIFRPHEWAWTGELKALRLPLIASLLFLGQALFHKKIPKFNNPIAFLILTFLLLEFIADITTGCTDYPRKVRSLFDITLIIVIVLITAEIIEQKKHLYWLITVIALSIGFHSGKAGFYALSSGANFYGISNLTGLFSGSNAFALGTGILIFYMIISFQGIKYIDLKSDNKNWKPFLLIKALLKWKNFFLFKTLFIMMIFGSLYNIIALSSRGSFLATSGGLLLWMILHERRKTIIPVFIISISLALAVIPLPDNYKERISSAFADKEELDHSAAGRPHFWATAFEIAKDHPLGVGPGCFPPFYNKYDSSDGEFGYYRSVHSSHFQVLSEIGFMGTLIWILLFIVSFKKLWSIRKKSKRNMVNDDNYRFYFVISNGLICSIAVFLVGGSFYEFAYSDLIWLSWGLVIAVERLFKKEFSEA